MKGHRRLRNERGTALLFMIGTLFFLMIFGGIAIDLSFLSAAKGELQRSMDAAALAGAGHLGLNESVFPTVREEAHDFALLNPTRANLSPDNPSGAIDLDLNTGNADLDGEITLGVWDGATFTPSLVGSEVNAVRCQYATDVPMAFLRFLGPSFNTLPVWAQAIAIANPPDSVPEGVCLFPMGVTSCQFQNAGAYTSQGCGTPITFATSSGQPPDTQAGTNTGAWIDPNGTGVPNANTLNAAITAAAEGQGGCNSSVSAGDPVGTNNGMIQPVVNTVEAYFITKYGESEASGSPITTHDFDGNPTYTGYGWEVSVGVIQTDCPPQAIAGDHLMQTYARFVITQVINNGDCAVNNPADANSWSVCPPPMNPNGAPKDASLRAIFGYFECQDLDTTPTTTPAPRAGLGTGRRLVQ